MYAASNLAGMMKIQHDVSAAEGALFAKEMNDFAKKIREIGPKPIRL
jgi:coenzyme F420-reducing hydrogenase delta subunit